MSLDFRTDKQILMEELFDGRLAAFGVGERVVPSTSREDRLLSDGVNSVWAHGCKQGHVSHLTVYGLNSAVFIADAICRAFDTWMYTEHEPQYWGFDTQEAFDAWMREGANEAKEDFYLELMDYLQGRPHRVSPGTNGMKMLEIGRDLVAHDPGLALPARKEELLTAIDEKFMEGELADIKLEGCDLSVWNELTGKAGSVQ